MGIYKQEADGLYKESHDKMDEGKLEKLFWSGFQVPFLAKENVWKSFNVESSEAFPLLASFIVAWEYFLLTLLARSTSKKHKTNKIHSQSYKMLLHQPP